jgi:transposase-like protein
MKYSAERRESVLKKLLPPQARGVAEVSEEEGICTATLFNWRNSARSKGQLMPDSDKPAKRWSSEEKFIVVLESASMNETQTAEYCRKRGVYQEQIAQWREACKSANEPPSRAQHRRNQAAARADQKKIKQLETELDRKNSALAETAALLVLRKKVNAIWGSEEDV